MDFNPSDWITDAVNQEEVKDNKRSRDDVDDEEFIGKKSKKLMIYSDDEEKVTSNGLAVGVKEEVKDDISNQRRDDEPNVADPFDSFARQLEDEREVGGGGEEEEQEFELDDMQDEEEQ